MATFELRQNLKLTQQLIMTPQLQQAIKLLQLSRLELADMISQEMEENPLLEEVNSEGEQDEGVAGAVSDELQPVELDETKNLERTVELTGEGDGKEEFDWENYLEDYVPTGVTHERHDGEAPNWDNLLTKPQSLTDHLMWQLKLSPFCPEEMRVGEQIIGNLDQNGYLAATLEEIAEAERVEVEIVDAVLKKIQEFDPPGIAARDLKECLLIQARLLGTAPLLVSLIINDYLKDLENKNYEHIARKLKVPLDDVVQAVSIICGMDPRPGSLYNEERPQAIIPDVYVFKSGDEYKVVLNEDGVPRLRISSYYRDIIGGNMEGRDAERGRKYIRERVQSAQWLIKGIQQRQKTIARVSESIVRFQRGFFDQGIQYLKPLVLRDIADDLEMHESTISRVVTNKYMYTPRGIFELKYFFSSSIQKTSGDAIASKSVKDAIKKIITGENPKKPYSDNEIVDILGASGITIARRTVAKYREVMNILPSSRRKKYF